MEDLLEICDHPWLTKSTIHSAPYGFKNHGLDKLKWVVWDTVDKMPSCHCFAVNKGVINQCATSFLSQQQWVFLCSCGLIVWMSFGTGGDGSVGKTRSLSWFGIKTKWMTKDDGRCALYIIWVRSSWLIIVTLFWGGKLVICCVLKPD